jgi:hypothetical protein
MVKKKLTQKQLNYLRGGKYKQDLEKNEGYFGKIMNEKTGKLNNEEICHNCSPSAYAKGARKFCKIHGKTWNPKTNSCVKGKKRKSKKSKKHKSQKSQKGGAFCLPCISPILTGLGVFGAGAAATGAVAKGISMTKSKMSSSNGKLIREQYFDKSLSGNHSKNSKKKKKTKRANDKLKFYIKQENNIVTFKKNDEKLQKKVFNKSKNMKENIKKATDFYDKKIHYCVVKGYRKC